MIDWPWLIPTFIIGGMFGFMIFCIVAAAK